MNGINNGFRIHTSVITLNGYGPKKFARRDLKQIAYSGNNLFVNKIVTGNSGIDKKFKKK